jgi:hypothetical protein
MAEGFEEGAGAELGFDDCEALVLLGVELFCGVEDFEVVEVD